MAHSPVHQRFLSVVPEVFVGGVQPRALPRGTQVPVNGRSGLPESRWVQRPEPSSPEREWFHDYEPVMYIVNRGDGDTLVEMDHEIKGYDKFSPEMIESAHTYCHQGHHKGKRCDFSKKSNRKTSERD